METDDSTAHSGTRSLKIIGINATGTATHSQVRHEAVSIENGKTYTVAFWAKVDESEGQSREVKLVGRTQFDPYAGFYNEDILLDSTDWKEYKISFLANMFMMGDVYVSLAVAQSEVSFWIDDFRFFEGMPEDEIVESDGTRGDLDGDGEVGAYDAALLLQSVVGLTTLTDDQKWAADMNDDGNIGSDDALRILYKTVGLAAPSAGVHTTQIFFYKETLRILSIIELAEAHGAPGQRVAIPLKVDNISSLAGGDICVIYNSKVLRAVSVSSDPGILMASNIAEPGAVRIAFAAIDGLKDETLAVMKFDVLADGASPLIIKSARFYSPDALPMVSRGIHGKFASWAVPPERSDLLQNFPNPFNPETWIPYQLREGGEVTIRIFSARGDLARELRLGYKSAGLYITRDRAAYWNGTNEAGEAVASGVYFYTIQAGEFSATRKMVVAQ